MEAETGVMIYKPVKVKDCPQLSEAREEARKDSSQSPQKEQAPPKPP